ncbi:MAG: hypothetical protein JRD89_14425 [Deltaproteobacteria bacterium]|nr:hypothetical protein [Deltaproteobacteria bacterium]
MSVITIAKKIDIAAGAEATTPLYGVKSAQTLTLKRVIFHFPAGSAFLVGLSVRRGIYDVCPEHGLVYGDDAVIELTDDSVFSSGETIELYCKNEDTTNAHQVVVVVEGEVNDNAQ